MLQTHQRLFSNTIVLADLCLVAIAVMVGWWWPYASDSILSLGTAHETQSPGVLIACAAFAWFLLAGRFELYRSRRTERLRRELVTVLETWLVTLSLTAVFANVVWKGVEFHVVSAFVAGTLLLFGVRLGIRAMLRELRVRGRNTRFALIVGRGKTAASMTESLARRRHYGMVVRGAMHFQSESLAPPDGLAELGPVWGLRDYLRTESVDYVIVCPSLETATGEIHRVFLACERAGIGCHYAPCHFGEEPVEASVAWYGAMPAFSFTRRVGQPFAVQIKRLVDVVGATIGLIGLSPFFLAVAIAIKLQDRRLGRSGPVFFKQTRIGQNGRRFTCLKFRTMCVDAEQQRVELDAENEQDGPVFKMENDPRITPLGRILRKFSLDELPQLLNVWAGDMSLVGPRPPTPEEVDRYDWWQRRRISVRPGLTCVWQVWGRNQVSFQRWMEMDLYYIDNWSLWLDVKLLAHTIRAVAMGTGM